MLNHAKIMWSFAALVLAVLLAAVALLSQAPRLSPKLVYKPATSNPASPASTASAPVWFVRTPEGDQAVVALVTPSGRWTASANLAIPEPDMLPGYAEYNHFMQAQHALTQAANQQQLVLELASGQRMAVQAQRMRPRDFPAIFWFQLFVGAAGALTGAAIYIFSQRSRATLYFFMTGLGYLVFAPSAAVYSSRELLMDGQVIRVLSGINHFGAMLFTVSLAALLWCYPKPLRAWPVPVLLLASGLVLWLMDQWQWLPDLHWVAVTVLGFFALAILFALGQYVRTRHHPLHRASFRWFIVSILLGTGLFAAFILIPVALRISTPVDQGWMFGAFLLMYWGLALGLIRYRLFELEDWWFSIWTWFFGGVAVVVLDLVLMSSLSLDSNEALIWALAIGGWVYFPIRQKLLQRLTRNTRHDPRVWLRQALPPLMNLRPEINQTQQIQAQWRHILQRVFDPLHVEMQPPLTAGPTAKILNSGESMLVRGLTPDCPALLMHHVARGQWLFASSDVERVEEMRQLASLALSVAQARDQGIRTERARIAKEIHDDLGAHLTTLLVQAPPQQQQVVQRAMADMRLLLQSMEEQEILLEDAAAQWRQETAQRLEQSGRLLDWQSSHLHPCIMGALTAHHIAKILREAITNALRHGNAQPVQVFLHTQSTPHGIELHIKVVNGLSASLQPVETRHHRGLINLEQRAISIGGQVRWAKCADVFELTLKVPLTP